MARQFGEIWERLGRPDDFVIVEQGAHDGTFASDVLAAARDTMPEFFAALRYRIVEPFPVLRDRQNAMLESFRLKIDWVESIEQLEPFTGVHFSNELIDAMPVHLVCASNKEWREKYVTLRGEDLDFTDGPISSAQLQEHLEKLPVPADNYETEINLVALDWIEQLSAKIERGVVLAVDYGWRGKNFTRRHARAGHSAPLRNIDSLPRRSSTQAILISPRMSTGRACARKPNDVA